MIYRDHPKRDVIITFLVAGIGLIIILFAIFPFLGIKNTFVKGLLVFGALLLGGYPIWKSIFVSYKKSAFEMRKGRKLK